MLRLINAFPRSLPLFLSPPLHRKPSCIQLRESCLGLWILTRVYMIGVLSSALRLNVLTLIKCKQCNGFLSIRHISKGDGWYTWLRLAQRLSNALGRNLMSFLICMIIATQDAFSVFQTLRYGCFILQLCIGLLSKSAFSKLNRICSGFREYNYSVCLSPEDWNRKLCHRLQHPHIISELYDNPNPL